MSTQRANNRLAFPDSIELGVGNWAWGDKLFWGHRRRYTDADAQAAFEASLAAGVNFFDTAEFYGLGRAERLLGRFMRASGQPVMVATKFMPYPWRLWRGSLLRALRGSLHRLGMAQVDMMRQQPKSLPFSGWRWMDALADAVEAGLTRMVGVSNYSLAQMRRAHVALAQRGIALASNQVEYSLLHRDPERSGLLDACRELGVTLIAYSPLAKGLLTGKYTPENPPPAARHRLLGSQLARAQPLVGLMREIGQARGGKTPAQVALNWAICKGAVPIPGARNAGQAAQNAGAIGWRLTDDEIAALDAASED